MTWDQLAVLAEIGGLFIAGTFILTVYINKVFQEFARSVNESLERNRKESEDGRREIYKLIRDNMDEVRKNYVHKEVMGPTIELLKQTDEEHSQQIIEMRNLFERRYGMRSGD
jgi:hypothetical protein